METGTSNIERTTTARVVGWLGARRSRRFSSGLWKNIESFVNLSLPKAEAA